MSWKKRAPASWIVSVPSITVPQLKSRSSSWWTKSGVLVASLRDGAGLQPYAEPRPVVKQIRLAPPATCPVAEVGQRFFDLILETASGRKTKSELFGYGDDEFAPWIVGATM